MKNLTTNKWLWIISALLVIVVVGFLIVPGDDHDFEVDGIYYEIVDDISYSVKVVKHEYSGAVVIPKDLTYRARNYTVTEIGAYAFNGCSKMTSIFIPESVWHVGIGAFNGCINLKEVYCKSLTPPSINSSYNNFHNDVVIYVPKGTREAYREASSLFENVVEVDFTNINLK